MKTWHGRAVILFLATVLCVACAPTPLVPSGKSRVPVNSDEGISQYRERVKVDQRDRVERNGLVRQIEALTKQIQELKSYVTLLQLQQQESEKGRGRQVQKVGAGGPPRLSHARDKTAANNKEATTSPLGPPITAAPHEAAGPPLISITEEPADLCEQRIGAANPHGSINPTSDSLSRTPGLGAEHGLCRHISSSAAPIPGK